MLRDAKTIALALTDFKARTQLVNELDQTAEEDEQRFEKYVLAFWLGATTILDCIRSKYPTPWQRCQFYLYIGYYCFLALDKQISLITDKSSFAYQALGQCRLDLMLCYNKNSYILKNKPGEFFLLLWEIVAAVDSQKAVHSADRKMIEEAKKQCVGELNRLRSDNNKFLPPESFEEKTKLYKPTSLVSKVSDNVFGININVAITRFITGSSSLFPFFNTAVNLYDTYTVNKIFLPAEDGIILEGLHIKKRNTSENTIVLALVGHFQFEDMYLSYSLDRFYDLFSTDVVLINHRNYSTRAAKKAASAAELANDVVAFANYFHDDHKKIVLYGMCGGAPHIILAANKLTEKSIPYKVIIDRFSRKYNNFYDFKTIMRLRRLGRGDLTSPFNVPSSLFNFMLLLLPFSIYRLSAVSVTWFTSNDTDFGKYIRKIPAEDLLVLQAKGEKLPDHKETLMTDLYVHPKNDMRTAIKDRRHKNKEILKNLRQYCLDIAMADAYFCSQEIQMSFRLLAKFFEDCLKLIANEKLTLSFQMDRATDLHTYQLFQLSTRNGLAVQKFVHGFFSTSNNENLYLAKLEPYNEQAIQSVLESLYQHDKATKGNLARLASSYSQFLNELMQNKDFITHMSNRLSATGLGGINAPLNAILESEVFKRLSTEKSEITDGFQRK